MVGCSVFGCTNRSTQKSYRQVDLEKDMGQNISFFIFPKDKERLELWLPLFQVYNKNWMPTNFSRVCSMHFSDNCCRVYRSKVILHKLAVPSYFPTYPPEAQQFVHDYLNDLKNDGLIGDHEQAYII